MADRKRDLTHTPADVWTIREAGGELREYGIRMAEWGYEATLSLNPKASIFDIRFALDPIHIAPALKKSWRNISKQTERVLVSVGIIDQPIDFEKEVSEELFRNQASFTTTTTGVRDKALGFFGERYAILDLLGREAWKEKYEPHLWTALVFQEDVTLRGAFYQGLLYYGL